MEEDAIWRERMMEVLELLTYQRYFWLNIRRSYTFPNELQRLQIDSQLDQQ